MIFQIALSIYKLDLLKKKNTYKLDSQNKNTLFFLAKKKKKSHHTRVARVMRLVYIYTTI